MDDARDFFLRYDVDLSGRLDKRECLSALKRTFPSIDLSILSSAMEVMWPKELASMTLEQFVASGLFEVIKLQIDGIDGNDNKRIPDIRADKQVWFRHFDSDNSGCMDLHELKTAFVKTFPAADDNMVEALLIAVWPGGPSISLETFMRENGVCDTIVAQMTVPARLPVPLVTPMRAQVQVENPMPQEPHFFAPPTISGRRKGLLVGILYQGTRGALKGCYNDVKAMQQLLTKTYGWDASSLRILSDSTTDAIYPSPTKAKIIENLKWLVSDAKSGDVLFFHFSGHGAQEKDPRGYEEDGLNECILPLDYTSSGIITDDLLSEVIVEGLPDGVRLTCVLDMCHSGSALDLPFTWKNGKWKEDLNPFFSRGDVQMFSGCTDDSTSCDVRGLYSAPGGALTSAFVSALKVNPCPTYLELLDRCTMYMVQNGFNQRPQLSSSQRFETDRPFLFDDIIPNGNELLGRIVRQRTRAPSRRDPDLDQMTPLLQMLQEIPFDVLIGSFIRRTY